MTTFKENGLRWEEGWQVHKCFPKCFQSRTVIPIFR